VQCYIVASTVDATIPQHANLDSTLADIMTPTLTTLLLFLQSEGSPSCYEDPAAADWKVIEVCPEFDTLLKQTFNGKEPTIVCSEACAEEWHRVSRFCSSSLSRSLTLSLSLTHTHTHTWEISYILRPPPLLSFK
jgi:hypothetical protein